MTYRVCSVCNKKVEWAEKFYAVEVFTGDRWSGRVGGHFYCVTQGVIWNKEDLNG